MLPENGLWQNRAPADTHSAPFVRDYGVKIVPWLSLSLATPLCGVAAIAFEKQSPVPRIELQESAPESPAVSVVIPDYTLTTLERETIAACLVLEAASQGELGMRSVMSVIRNRSRQLPELLAPTVLRPKQFSALNHVTSGRKNIRDAVARARRDRMWTTALRLVDDACNDDWHDPTLGATHYTRSSERIYWTRNLARTVTIGAHSFYR